MHHLDPMIGSWYEDLQNKQLFEVVATDHTDGSIEIQYFSGEIEEIEQETWQSLHLVSIPAPEDFSGPYEFEREDLLEFYDEVGLPQDWNGPLNSYEW